MMKAINISSCADKDCSKCPFHRSNKKCICIDETTLEKVADELYIFKPLPYRGM